MSTTTYAKVENGIVTSVKVVTYEFLVANPERYGPSELWVKCFQDGSGRGYCGIGYTYDVDTDQFVTPQPFPSWVLDSNNDWQAPTPKPEGSFIWDEETLAWVETPAI